MKLLFVGTLISKDEMERLNTIGKRKASVAPNNYESMLVKGLAENGADIDVFSVPALAAYPGNPTVFVKEKKEVFTNGVDLQWVPFINAQVLKQATIQINTYEMVKNWLESNKDVKNKCVISFSIYPPYTKPLVKLCKKYNCHLSTVITDLPEYMYTWGHNNPISRYFGNIMKNKMTRLQGLCDSYVLFTEKMARRMGVDNKPYIVSEGVCDTSIFEHCDSARKYDTKTIVYAGNLSRIYGIRKLIDGFMLTKGQQELHLYGSGEDVEYIKQCAQNDNRIKFFGRVSRSEVLIALKRAHLIVINKPTDDDYSNYSFSSKILECMSSGTPILTTRVGGMPKDYYPFFYFINDESAPGICNAIENTIGKNSEELIQMGEMASQFAVSNKNYYEQAKKIIDFFKNQL